MFNVLHEYQNAVDGWIQALPLEDGAYLICNESGKLIGLPTNRIVGNDVIVGAFLIVGADRNGEFISLTNQQIEYYSNRFRIAKEHQKGGMDEKEKDTID